MADLPSPPFIEVDGIPNFRDLGGHPIVSNPTKTFRPGLVFRSADPSEATTSGLQKLRELSITVIFDLRSQHEANGPRATFEAYDIERRHVPVFEGGDWGPEQLSLRYRNYARSGSAGFVAAYSDILRAGTETFGTVLRYIVKAEGACLVHCSAGKDRTGVLCALLLLLAGVGKEAVADEYALTDLGMRGKREESIARLMKHPAMEGNREGVENMVSARKGNMVATIEMIGRDFGGAEGYVKGYLKMDDSEVAALKKKLVA